VAVSLDGYIRGPSGEIDWIVVDPDIDFSAFMQRFDTVLMGRKSYEEVKRLGGDAGSQMKTYVFSRTLRQEDCTGVTVCSDPQAAVAELRSEPGKDIWLFGGGELFASLLELGLVDVVEVAIIPVLLGDGLPLLPYPGAMAKLELAKHRVYQKTGTVLLEYSVV
jgi:dihydrofolate reductase